ncbi:hypothetical protein ACPUEK_13590 [Marinomonas gallaica]|uniref:hypothetical protein n=1 Tax=Marinomonas gallaica TaxID=1806667 RepID=UPI003CE4E790
MGCYYCGGKVTGVEHVPPKSFFPKGLRQDLITVDSCDLHNQEKSKEDEYIRAILLSSIKIDEQPHLEVLRNTSMRAIERSVKRAFEKQTTREQAQKVLEIIEKYKDDPVGGAKAFDEISSQGIMNLGLMGLVTKDTRGETVVDSNGLEVKAASFLYDEKRFYAFFDCMARGIFYHELGERCTGRVNILPHTFLREDAPQRDKDLSEDFLKHFDWAAAKGAQKEIFCYEGANRLHPETGERESIFFNFCLFNTFYFTAVFPL